MDLNENQREKIPRDKFVFPEKAPGPGSYPVPDRRHAIVALGRAKANATPQEYKAILDKVCSLYPDLPHCKERRIIHGRD
jgi:hypothetical protein